MHWETSTQEKFRLFISKIPVFHRRITEKTVFERAEENAAARLSKVVEEQDVLAAFFSDVPSPFYSMMMRLLEQTGFDYKKYGYPRNTKS